MEDSNKTEITQSVVQGDHLTISGYPEKLLLKLLIDRDKMAEQNPATALSAKVDKKRKRHAEEQSSKTDKADGATATTVGNASSDGSNKKRKKNKEKYNKNKGKKDKSENKDKQDKPAKPAEPPKEREGKDGINESIRMMDGALLADHFAQRTKKFNKEMTPVELNDLHVPGEWKSILYSLSPPFPTRQSPLHHSGNIC